MPPKKRSSHSKATPPSSPMTSTPHAHADHPHQNPLRGHSTGSIIGTRARTSSKPPPPPERTSASQPKDAVIAEEEQDKKAAKKSKPVVAPRVGGSTKFAKFVYALTSIAVVLLVWYAYGMVTLLARLKDEIGWWDVVVGGDSSMARGGRGMRAWERFSPRLTVKGWGFGSGSGGDRKEGGDLEGSLNALADALGIDPVEVALAVRPLVPRASLTSVASKARRTGGSEAVRVLLEGYAGATTIVQEFGEDAAEGEVLD